MYTWTKVIKYSKSAILLTLIPKLNEINN